MPPSIAASTAVRFPFHRPCRSTPIRAFSHGRNLRASAQIAPMEVRMPARPSPATMRDRQMRNPRLWLDKDVGVFDGNFIPPTGHNRPSWLHEPRLRWKMAFLTFWIRTRLWAGLRYMKWFGPAKHLRPRVDVSKGPIRAAAKKLHQTMHSAFARGDRDAIAKCTLDGLRLSLSSRLGTRKASDILRWHSDYESISVISDKIAEIPGAQKTGDKLADTNLIRQAVVRIDSRQTLRRGKPGPSATQYVDETRPRWESNRVLDQKEYVLIQQCILQGKVHPWKLWGMVEESNPDGTAATAPKPGAQLRKV